MKHQPWVTPTRLEGRFIRLEPIGLQHVPDLAGVAEDSLFRYFAGQSLRKGDESYYREWVGRINGEANKVAFAIVHQASGRAIGTTTYMDIKPHNRGLEIGSTWMGKAFHGTAANPEAKFLLLQHAFEALDAIRVQFRTDIRNLQSRRAIEKLGAKQDGVFRSDTIMPDGYIRDSVFFSILQREWPTIKVGLEARLGQFESRAR